MIDAFVGWTQHAPMWQIYSAMTASLLLLILLLLPKRMRAMKWGKRNIATRPIESAKIAAEDLEETRSHDFAVKNVNAEATPKQSGRTSVDENGTKTDCSPNQISAASVINQS